LYISNICPLILGHYENNIGISIKEKK